MFVRRAFLITQLCFLCLFLTPFHVGLAEELAEEKAVAALARDQEKQGYIFRAGGWVGAVQADVGRAVRMQLFKGNEYCLAVAAPRDSGARLTGEVLDLEGQPTGEIQPVLAGWGFLLFFKPAKTGVYAITIRQEPNADGKKQPSVPCAMMTGYR